MYSDIDSFLDNYHPMAILPVCSARDHIYLYGLKRYLDEQVIRVQNVDQPWYIVLGERGLPCENAGGLVRVLARPTGIKKTQVHTNRLLRVFRNWEEVTRDEGQELDTTPEQTLGLFQKLPVETRITILAFIEDATDLCCLSVAHSLLFEIGFDELKRRYLIIHSKYSWIGHRIICYDRCVMPESAPKRLYTPEQIKERREWLEQNEPQSDLVYYYSAVPTKRELLHTTWNISILSLTKILAELTERVERTQQAKLGREWTKADSTRMDTLLQITRRYSYTYRSDHPWVIYNLTKGEYIRADVCFPSFEKNDALATNGLRMGLAELLMARIVWTTHGAYTRRWRISSKELPSWAGDRFAIAPLNEQPVLDANINGGVWKDVSVESAQLIGLVTPVDAKLPPDNH
ncbi:hypothetical protein BXZ70DRAFT_138119 [Cristinia sonorae]|uniref:Uncharacterized protein n=1 Tax=Cristinia sonorae TaxID=1940300 RepID=A0A8K0UQF0_9AGAR|nr:hypothetical protein BXZ70DRAFT_138119 [Cristinia sonorae]